MKKLLVLMFGIGLFAASGCAARYVTPAAGVSMAEFTDADLKAYYARQPASPFPSNIAVLRVQDAGYRTSTVNGYGHGRYSVVTARDVETDDAFEKVGGLPLVGSVAPVGRMLLPPDTDSIDDLRAPAARLRADMLMVYTMDTTFTVDGRSLGPLSMVSLGFIPNKRAHVTSTVSGVLIDVRTGFIYGTAEATAREEQRATMWSTRTAIDGARLRAERQAFGGFVDEFSDLWGNVLDVHAATRQPTRREQTPAGGYYRVRFE